MDFPLHNPELARQKIKAIIDHYGHGFFAKKKIIDLGSGNGEISSAFARLGAEVLCVDARQDSLNFINNKYPFLKTMKVDLDNEWPFDSYYDMVLSLDLLCHLKNYEKHIKNICGISENIILETEVLDSDNPDIRMPIYEEKSIADLSFHGEGSIVSANSIQNKLSDLGATFKRIDNAKLNAGSYKYNWQETNSEKRLFGNRRFWFIRRDRFFAKKIENQQQARNIENRIPTSKVIPFQEYKTNNKIENINNSQKIYLSDINSNIVFPDHNTIYDYQKDNIFNKQSIPFGNTEQKIKIYIITYNGNNFLDKNLNSLFSSDVMQYNPQIYIINNHSHFYIDDKYKSKVNIMHNLLRPDFSTGHLSRNWNQCIINGFRDLNHPDCDIVMTCQVDTVFKSDWFSKLLNLHSQYSFIQYGIGDNLISYLPDAIRKIGLWDERFCNIGYQEGDMFLRALMYNKHRSCINDVAHGRVLNPTNLELIVRPAQPMSEDHKKSFSWHSVSAAVFKRKYGRIDAHHWKPELINNPPKKTLNENYVYYPYFEKDVEDLYGKNYVWAEKIIMK